MSWWQGEGDANDLFNTNNGILQGGLGFTNGEAGLGFYFNNTNDDVRVPSSQSLNVGTGNGFTLEGWIRCTNPAVLNPIFEWNTGNSWGVHFYVGGAGSGSLYANIPDTSGAWHTLSSAQGMVVASAFQHVALTYDKTSGTAIIYCNGTNVAQASPGNFTPQTSYDLYIGRRPGPDIYTFAGIMDELSLYGRALSQAEVQAIYNAGSAGKCFTPVPPVIGSQPAGQTNAVGGMASFSVSANGSEPLNYQWRFNGTNLPAATNSTLALSNLSLSQAGNYDVVVSNYVGSVTSAPAILDVRFILVEVNGQIATGTVPALAPASISLFGGYPGGFLFYTLDGSTPTSGSMFYSGPFVLTNSATIRVMSLSSDFSQQSEGIPVTVQIIPAYSLQTSIVGNGSLTTNPAAGSYPSNSVVVLTATPAANWAFAHWAGDTNGSQNPLSVTMNGPRNIQAVFVQSAFPLTLTTSGSGSAKANGVVIAPATYYPTDSVVTLTATPVSGWGFVGWQGTVNSTNNPLNLVVTQTNNIQAIFMNLSPCASVPSGIASWWQGEGNANDLINSNNGTVHGALGYTNGIVGQAFVFDDSTSYISLPASPTLDIGGAGSGITIEAWILPNSYDITVSSGPIIEWDSSSTDGLQLWTGGSLVANIKDTSGNAHSLSSPVGLVTNSWQHVALTYDKTSGWACMYMNGIVVVSNNFGSITPQTTYPVNIGRRTGQQIGLNDTYGGLLDELAIYNRALSPAEIQAIFNAGSAGKCFTPTPPVIGSQPVSQTNYVGGTAGFSVAASGSVPLYYQWRLNGANLPAATNSTLALSNLSLSQAGNYDVVVSNYVGSVTSSPAILDVRFILIEVNGQPAAGTNTAVGSATITLLGGYAGGYLFYTLDGSAPSASSLLYSGPFVLTNSTLVRVASLSSDFSQQTEGVPAMVLVIPTYSLQTSVVGSGTVTLNPPTGPYASNSVVTLTPMPAAHWSFVYWAGDANGSQIPLSVTMNGPRNIQAVFVQNAYPLTLTTPGGGSVTANGINIGASATYYPTGTVVSLAATPSSGWLFLRWQGSISSTNNPVLVTMNQTNNIQAIFGTLVTTNATGGAVVLSPPNPVPYGTSVVVSAVPNPGNYLVNWTGNLSGLYSPIRYTVTTANPTFGALFTPLPTGKFTLATIINGNGIVGYSPQASYYSSNTTVALTASAGSGANFFGWSLGATGRTSPLPVLVTNNTVIQANFGVAPTVTVSPLNQTVFAGSNAVLTASEMGLPPLTNQWQNSQGAIPGATNATLILSNIQPAGAGGYFVVVSSSVGSVTSAVATVTVISSPVITNQPSPATLTVGHSATFTVGAYGAPLLAYQWWLNGLSVPGATNAMLSIPNAFPANAGAYRVVVTNAYGSVTSTPAGLSVLPLYITLPAKKLANGQFQITFDTASGVNYEVDSSSDLVHWSPWLYVSGNGQPLTLSDPGVSGNAQRYYRISLSPQ